MSADNTIKPVDRTQQQIYSRLQELGTPVDLGLGGQSAAQEPHCFWGPDDLENAAQALIGEFGADELLRRGIIEQDPDHPPRLVPEFGRNSEPLILLQGKGKPLPFAIASSGYSLIRDQIPLVAFLRDDVTRQHLKTGGGVLVLTSSLRQVAMLRALGIAAAPFFALEKLNTDGLRELQQRLQRLGLLRPKPKKTAEGPNGEILVIDESNCMGGPEDFRAVYPRLSGDSESAERLDELADEARPKRAYEVQLVLTDWEAPDGQPTYDQLRRVASYLLRMEQLAQVDLPTVGVWHPTKEDRQEISFIMRRGNAADVRRQILHSIDSAYYRLDHILNPESSPLNSDTDLASATERLNSFILRAPSEQISKPQWIAARDHYAKATEHTLIEPLLQSAAAAEDPIQRSLLVCWLTQDGSTISFRQSFAGKGGTCPRQRRPGQEPPRVLEATANVTQ